MKKNSLLTHYVEHSEIQLLAHKLLNSNTKKIHIPKPVGSLMAILPAAIGKITKRHQLIIIQNQEEALYIYTDLKHLLPEFPVFFFPSVKNSTKSKHKCAHEQLNQLYTLWHLTHQPDAPAFIITYPEALTNNVFSQQVLIQNTLTLSVQDYIKIEEITRIFIDNDFIQKDFVNNPGEFALRGNIIDIFDYANPCPIRIELWGNQIEKIKCFNPDSQYTIQKIDQVNIFTLGQNKIDSHKQISLLDHCPSSTIAWVKNYAAVLAYFNQNIRNKSLEKDFQINFSKKVSSLTCVSCSSHNEDATQKMFSYQSLPQPTFNQNFDLWKDHLVENKKKGLSNFITTTSARQIERLQKVFNSSGKDNTTFQTLHLGLSAGFIDKTIGIACYTDHQIFSRHYRYISPQKQTKKNALTLKNIHQLKIGDYVVHRDYGIGRFTGLTQMEVQGNKQEAMRLVYKNNDLIFVGMQALHKITKYSTQENAMPKIDEIGSPAWANKKKKVKKKIEDMATSLITLYSKRKAVEGFAFAKDTVDQVALESAFMYEDTPDQAKATVEVKKDMEKPYPMDRLICGDVGFGKTEIAMRAAFKAIQNDKQVAVLAPTTVLTLQHYKSFQKRFQNYAVTIEYINRFKSTKEIKNIHERIKNNDIKLIIGTHSLLNKAVQFPNLGLLIVDEEQKFGVQAKEKLKALKLNVDVLTLTATPIPRTLHFSLMGARDMSIITTPPPNRLPVITKVQTLHPEEIKKAIHHELSRNGQIFFVHNRIHDLQSIADMMKKIVPQAHMAMAHGQMSGAALEKIMLQFVQGEVDILLSTNIIESGLDIPNANTILINNAHMFGLSDLHQMRGRVGRSNQQGFCYLLSPLADQITHEARKRLKILEEFSNLGDGFQVAMRDLDIRGAGNILGSQQSGFINDLGFETYHQILNETIDELKKNKFQEIFSTEDKKKVSTIQCTVETDWDLYIPLTYISNTEERLHIYTWMNKISTEEEIKKLQYSLEDKFGPLPQKVVQLIQIIQLRCLANKLFIEKIKLFHGNMQVYCAMNRQKKESAFVDYIILYTQKNPQQCHIKKKDEYLIFTVKGVSDIIQIKDILVG